MKLLLLTLLAVNIASAEVCYDPTSVTQTEFDGTPKKLSKSICEKEYKERLKTDKSIKKCLANNDPLDRNYIDRLNKTFTSLDAIYTELSSKPEGENIFINRSLNSDNAFFAVNKRYEEIKNVEFLSMTRMSSQDGKAGSANQNWDQYEHKKRGERIKLKSPIHDFLKNGKLESKKQELKDIVINNMARFKRDFKCEFGVDIVQDFRIMRMPYEEISRLGLKSVYHDRNEFKRVLSQYGPQLEEAFLKYYPKEESLKRNYSCGKGWVTRGSSKGDPKDSASNPSCKLDLKHHFDDNASAISLDDAKESPEYKEFNACVNEMKAKGFKLAPEGIYIRTSASRLNNDPLKSNFCPWDFKGLSEARAASAKNLMKSFGYTDKEIKISSRGSNGNGSSGPCPYYQTKTGRRALLPEYNNNKDLLRDHRYVRVTARFLPKVSTRSGAQTYKIQKACMDIGYKCKRNPNGDSSLRKRNYYERFKKFF